MRAVVKSAVTTTFAGCLAFGLVGCGAPEQESPSQDTLAVQTSALSVTQGNLTAGECTATVSLDRSGTSLVGKCSDVCKRDGSVTLRFYIETLDASGIWRSVGFNYTGHSARLGGSTSITAANQLTGTYRALCNVDYVDSKQIHSGPT